MAGVAVRQRPDTLLSKFACPVSVHLRRCILSLRRMNGRPAHCTIVFVIPIKPVTMASEVARING